MNQTDDISAFNEVFDADFLPMSTASPFWGDLRLIEMMSVLRFTL